MRETDVRLIKAKEMKTKVETPLKTNSTALLLRDFVMVREINEYQEEGQRLMEEAYWKFCK